ncbi:unnamed protein product [Allacma fusca]|uniref:Uncharacterized protein n=1 Tax=Allacma fusca TaxID=39272 RepID=A0A8J2J3E4_9HEXA|nr:unnamed protein product [Allacma fusca]
MFYFYYIFTLSLLILHVPAEPSTDQEQAAGDDTTTVKTVILEEDQQGPIVNVIEQDVKPDEKLRGLQDTLIPILQGAGRKLLTAAVDNISSGSGETALQMNLLVVVGAVIVGCVTLF